MERKEDEGEAPRKRDQKRDQNIRVLWQTVRAMGSGRGVLQPQPRPRTRANPIRRCMVWGWMECYPFPGEGEGGGMRQDTHENWGFSWQDWGDWGTAREGCPLQAPNSQTGSGMSSPWGRSEAHAWLCSCNGWQQALAPPSKGRLAGSPAASPAIGRGGFASADSAHQNAEPVAKGKGGFPSPQSRQVDAEACPRMDKPIFDSFVAHRRRHRDGKLLHLWLMEPKCHKFQQDQRLRTSDRSRQLSAWKLSLACSNRIGQKAPAV